MQRLRQHLRTTLVWGLTLALTAWVIVLAWPTLAQALQHAQPAPHLWFIGGLLVLTNFALTGILWWIVHHPLPASKPVSIPTMTGLMVASSLLNLVPGPRLGLLGRSIFLKRIHGILLKDSSLAIGWLLLMTTVIFPLAAIPLLVDPTTGYTLWLIALPLVAWPSAILVHHYVHTATFPAVLACLFLRSAEIMAQALRLLVAARLIGLDLSLETALALSIVGLTTRLAAITPNGLGLTEAAMALSASWLSGFDANQIAAAALIDRAIETTLTILIGLPCMIPIRRAWKLASNDPTHEESTPPATQ
ncbi:MAG: lysylphosphatidylglycerol synthase domain-containing protein [Phycisphaeraceae bacterium]